MLRVMMLRVIEHLLNSCNWRYVLDALWAERNLAAVVRTLPRVASLHEIVGSIYYLVLIY